MTYTALESERRFRDARQRAVWRELMSFFTRQPTSLVPFERVREHLKTTTEIWRGTQMIPLDAIVGSVGRYRDFTREFLPREEMLSERWRRLDEAVNRLESIPPIDVYKLGDVYFVRDGNHRVSVARANGASHIEANVTEIPVSATLTPDMDVDQMMMAVESSDFTNRTALEELLPNAHIRVTLPGRYRELLEHIEVHRWYLGQERDTPVAWEEAVRSWYDNVYLPAVIAIRKSGLLQDFPERSEADLYLWVMRHMAELKEMYSDMVDPELAVGDLARKHTTNPLKKVARAVKDVTHKAQDLVTGGDDVPPIVEDLVDKLAEREQEEKPAD